MNLLKGAPASTLRRTTVVSYEGGDTPPALLATVHQRNACPTKPPSQLPTKECPPPSITMKGASGTTRSRECLPYYHHHSHQGATRLVSSRPCLSHPAATMPSMHCAVANALGSSSQSSASPTAKSDQTSSTASTPAATITNYNRGHHHGHGSPLHSTKFGQGS